MIRPRLHSLLLAGGVCTTLLAFAVSSQAQQYDPSYGATPQAYDDSSQAPGRVARLAWLTGQVQFAPAGEDEWGSVDINRPMVIGDRLLTGDDGRAVLELGDASVRIDHDSAFDFLNLDPGNVQIELSQGTLNLAVHRMDQGANFEVDTPTVAFVASTPGTYRIDNNPDGIGNIVTVFQGSGIVYGENGASRQVTAGQSYQINDSTLASVDVNSLPAPDDFDRFCEARDTRYGQYAQQSQQYVPSGMIGGEDLYQYGQWNATPDYGNVWYPTSVPSGWAPYRYGHWAWIQPWGWTWVDNQPWGFAPFHYGRWVHVRNRWGWMPGPINVRPVYAPALVAFLGGSGLSLSVNIGSGGRPVSWFPLGPRDVYVPWFHASRGYFTNVNITNIRHGYANRTVINNYYTDYRAGRPMRRHGREDYPYRHVPGAVTAVNRNVFVGARPVHPAVLKLDRNRLGQLDVAMRPGVNPGKSSLGLRRPTANPTVLRDRKPFTRPVVARHQPPPRPVSFATRENVIATQDGQPLTPVQIRNLQQHRPNQPVRTRNVKLVAASGRAGADHRVTPRPATNPTAGRVSTHPGVTPRPAEPAARRGTQATKPPFKNTVQPIRAPVNPVRNAPPRPNELPSSRFSHPGQPAATLPRAPVIRAAGNEPAQAAHPPGRLPVVKPVERAPRAVPNRTEPLRTQPQAQQQATRARQQQEQQATRARQQQAQQQAVRARQQQAQQQQRERAQQAQLQATRARQQQAVRAREQQTRQLHVQQPRPAQRRVVEQRQPQRAPNPVQRATPRQQAAPPSSKQHDKRDERRH